MKGYYDKVLGKICIEMSIDETRGLLESLDYFKARVDHFYNDCVKLEDSIKEALKELGE